MPDAATTVAQNANTEIAMWLNLLFFIIIVVAKLTAKIPAICVLESIQIVSNIKNGITLVMEQTIKIVNPIMADSISFLCNDEARDTKNKDNNIGVSESDNSGSAAPYGMKNQSIGEFKRFTISLIDAIPPLSSVIDFKINNLKITIVKKYINKPIMKLNALLVIILNFLYISDVHFTRISLNEIVRSDIATNERYG